MKEEKKQNVNTESLRIRLDSDTSKKFKGTGPKDKDKQEEEKKERYFNGVTQRERFRDILKIWSKVRQDNENAQLLNFTTYIQNSFDQSQSIKPKTFSIVGSCLCGYFEGNKIMCIDKKEKDSEGNKIIDKKYPIEVFDAKTNNYITIEYEREQIQKWCSVMSDEFNIDLNIDEELNTNSDNSESQRPEFWYKCGIYMYWDINRKKYLLEEIFRIDRKSYSKIGGVKENYLESVRYKYISSETKLDEMLNDSKYLLFAYKYKEEIYKKFFNKPIIHSEQLEKELKDYYLKKEEEKKEEEKKEEEKKEEEKKEEEKITVYKEDKEQFKNYADAMNVETRNACMKEMLKVWEEARDADKDGTLLSFSTYIENNFKSSGKFMPRKVFSISGNYLFGYVERGLIDCRYDDKGNRSYPIEYFSFKDNIKKSRIYTPQEIEEWCKTVNKEFNINLDIDKDLCSNTLKEQKTIPRFEYECGINMYWDIERKKYLIEDIFEIQKTYIERDYRNKLVMGESRSREYHLRTKRYKYISSTNLINDLEKIFSDYRINLLFQSNDKKDRYFNFFEITKIYSEQLEQELKEYYK